VNRTQLKAEHAAAGANYAKALATFRKAFVRLAAVERTLQNAHISDGETVTSFFRSRARLADSLHTFQHPTFVPELLVSEWTDPIVSASDEQIEGFTQDAA
jgi:hypothetical protein